MRVVVERGSGFAPWWLHVESVADCDRELAACRTALEITRRRWFPGRPRRQAQLAELIEQLLDARLVLAEVEVLTGVDQGGPLPSSDQPPVVPS